VSKDIFSKEAVSSERQNNNMNILIVKNVTKEGPGTIEDFLKGKGINYTVADFSGCEATEETIPDIRNFTHLVLMGGPMTVYESEGLPFFHFEVAMIRAFAKRGKAVLGICLGAQMIAHALGADVYKGEKQELGWDTVEITEEGMQDDAFSTLAVDNTSMAQVFQWHRDTFDLPKKAVRIASSGNYQNQAFRYGENVYGFQFHIEVTPEMIKEWFKKEEGVELETMLDQTHRIYPEYRKRADKFYERFFS
jgi:GMP synthase (glutamine-hydrolysing)